ncbi:UDP-3-O-acylglucosamine N-acyltransferase [Candidatus Desulfarcum epimagneticum]|uniref:UDP-3-O-acylglucosamine N-acyltransferase n=1 Tax=uncultured Desulfobacteraceae bacterium TaxID=218296 RepID=A0A484HD28_9BACT|nr:UDP-3-O-acylglucosamine N-acyltransferase [uncultured Desulfobacteraceae bacterium]
MNDTGFSLLKIAETLEGELSGDPDKMIRGAMSFEEASEDEIAWAADAGRLKKIDEAAAGAVIVPRDFDAPCQKAVIRAENPKAAFAGVLGFFHSPARPAPGISPECHIGKHFACGADPSIGPMVVIGNDVTVGDRVVLHPGAVIGDRVALGDDVEIFPNVSVLERCEIGSRVTLQAGAVIGSDGYGFVFDKGRHLKIPQTGIVRIDDDVEIGAGSAIDRATFGETRIRRGVKTDNLVHVAHNVEVGENTLLVAQVGIAGSSRIGNHVVIAGQAGIGGHLEIGDGAIIGPQAGIAKSVKEGDVVSGSPGMPHRVWLRVQRLIPGLPDIKKRITALEKKFDRIAGDS